MRDPLQPLSMHQAVAEVIAALKNYPLVEVKIQRSGGRGVVTSAGFKREVERAVETLAAKLGPERFRYLAKLDVQLKAVAADGVVFCVYR